MKPKTEIKYLKSFIIYTIIAVIAGLVVGAIQGAILGGILGASGVDLPTIQIISAISGFIFGSIVSFFVFRWVIQTQIIPQLANEYKESEQVGDGDAEEAV